MTLLLVALAILLAGGLGAVVLPGRGRGAGIVAVGSVVIASVLGAVPVVRVLAGGAPESFQAPWAMPFGVFRVGIDGLSAFFVLPILLLAAGAGLYGVGYLGKERPGPRVAGSWLLYNLLVAGMVLVVIARNGMLFLLAWEVMSVASFLLVLFDNEKPEVRRAAWTYLVATHVGTACLLAMFLLLAQGGASLDYDAFGVGLVGGRLAVAVFILAVCGFGTKAGLVPLHGWLPEAHPAAPSHVSALMSGVMIKTGVYGLLRVLVFLGPVPAWFGWVLVAVGTLSALYGALFSLVQGDLKRVLAYSSVENVGIIVAGIGIGLLGMTHHLPAVAFLGFGGAILHVLNHSLFKGLLFLAAGSVAHAAHTREIERLGGLWRRLPVTGAAFLVGAIAICGLPPMNGFPSEALIYLGALTAAIAGSGSVAVAGIVAITALALVGGLSVVGYTRAFGITFLGEPRSAAASDAREAGPAMRVAMVSLAVACVLAGFGAPFLLRLAGGAVTAITGAGPEVLETAAWAERQMLRVVLGFGCLVVVAAGIALVRGRLLAGRRRDAAVTWDCGYAAPTPRMQYTASGYSQPLAALFSFALKSRRGFARPAGSFPAETIFVSGTPDPVQERVYAPLFRAIARFLERLHALQGGMIQLYVLYIALALLILLAWKLG